MRALPFHFLDKGYTPPARRWIVSGLIAAGEVTALVGPPFAGKSAIAARLAADVAAGERFLGVPTERSAVLYIAAERAGATARRALAMRHSDGLDVALSSGPLALAEPSGPGSVLAAKIEIEARLEAALGLVIVDTLAACAVGLDENSQRDAGRIADGLQRIAEAGPAVVVIHHTSKGGTGVRGSSVLTGAFDRVLTLTKRLRGNVLRVESANDGDAGADFPFRLQGVVTGTDAEGNDIETVVVIDGCESAPEQVSTAMRARSLPPTQELALEALRNLGGKNISTEVWRRACYTIFENPNPATKRKNFNNARSALLKSGRIAECDDRVSVNERELA